MSTSSRRGKYSDSIHDDPLHMNPLLRRIHLIVPLLLIDCFVLPLCSAQKNNLPKTNPPIYIAFLWHMHQPIYWPYETVVQTDQNHRYSYSVVDIHNQRTGPYTTLRRRAMGIFRTGSHRGTTSSRNRHPLAIRVSIWWDLDTTIP